MKAAHRSATFQTAGRGGGQPLLPLTPRSIIPRATWQALVPVGAIPTFCSLETGFTEQYRGPDMTKVRSIGKKSLALSATHNLLFLMVLYVVHLCLSTPLSPTP